VAGTSDHFEAWVRGGPNGTPLICSVIDLRPEGATLVTPDIALPDKFTLLLLSDGSLSRACKVVSRQAYTVKVEFVGSGRS
jgi:hypothetical protein